MFKSILKFKGSWRTYQAGVLSSFDQYKNDGKIHIVAAPGSGKTTLGIELISRVGQGCIVLTPSITIREQWIERIEEAFLLEGVKSEDVLSQNLKDMKLITVVTYQALHSAMIGYKGKLLEEGDEETSKEELVDYESFDLISAIKERGVKTICLDECHHLRNEWWKSLEKFQSEATTHYTIALTATPPYDSTPELWARYIKVCGEIDEEITVPELVKDSTLCPHQDYVYFNYPTKEEFDKINQFKDIRDEYCDILLKDKELERIIFSNTSLGNDDCYDKLLENPAYLSSILIYLNATGNEISKEYKELLGYVALEKPSPKWFEILLQGVLYDDSSSYDISEERVKKYRNELKVRGLIENRKVCFQLKKKLKKDLTRSVGKCESVKEITFHEYKSLGKELRLLILCDYIKKEYKSAIGNPDLATHALGVIPFFELLRRESLNQKGGLKLGVLCGSVAIIPYEAKERLLELAPNPAKISFKSLGSLPQEEYVEVDTQGDRHFLTGIITQLFEEGYMEVLIGTKSLLGEGWDSPCVNSLILASFVGSFMLSNQMRGRAIRTYSKNPNKVSNIWHLVCVLPPKLSQDEQGLQEENEDMEMLTRRMDNFLGLHYSLDTIESGINRLSAIQYPITTKSSVKKTNAEMLRISANRNVLKERWQKALLAISEMEILEEVCKDNKQITFVGLFDYIRYLILNIILMGLNMTMRGTLRNESSALIGLSIVIGIMCIFSFIVSSKKLIEYINPLKCLQNIGEGTRKALMEGKHFDSSDHRVETHHDILNHVVYLLGGSSHDKELFAKCVLEIFSEVDNQRYILYAPSRKKKKDGYYPVPELFTKRKEDAQLYATTMKKYIGNYKLVYTRNPEGRKILLKGRKYAMANIQNRALKRKRVKGPLE